MAQQELVLNVRNHPIELIASNGPTALTNIGIHETKEGRVYHLSGQGNGQYHRDTRFFIQIDQQKKYKISWKYKCQQNCKFYQYIICYDKNKREISAIDVCRNGNAVIINGIDADNKTLRVDRIPKEWAPANSQVSTRIIGFYYDGYDVNERLYADNYIKYIGDWTKSDVNAGAYCLIDENQSNYRKRFQMQSKKKFN